ncbi:glycosyltransferase family 4 protein [Croceitalea vernalis]|uniref:Glycosyltransferase n=1 Tax=Croceitalea vernalis TaxID=3075599 RepID=A0ABU3BKI4_9FLAO|nr:glycosyltransferase [Croceitalea sp. P007]MDT0622664.1 glycosyltransferase [Croceitalea sp. P007]
MRTTVHYITNIAPLYRKNLWNRLLHNKDIDIKFFFGKGKSGIKEIDTTDEEYKNYQSSFFELKNYWFKSKILVWQSKVIANSFSQKPDLTILLGEFAVLSNWILALIYKVRRIPLVIYGHGMYGNEKGVKALLRKLYLKTADAHLVYENHAKNVMIQSGFNAKDIYVFYNSLDYDTQIKQRNELLTETKKSKDFFEDKSRPVVVFIGRLTEEKKLHYLIEISKRLEHDTPINLLFIGKGPVMESLKNKAKNDLKDKSYHFYGACYDESELGELLFNSDLCISPGNVGLTAIHALTYGTPVATHSNIFEQGPEVEAIQEGDTGFFFEQHNLEDLAQKTKEWINHSSINREAIRKKCFNIIETRYNPDNQLKIFKRLLAEQIKPES